MKRPSTLKFSGRLTFHVYPGAPNFEDVRRGDFPEPTYVLQLDGPVCATNTTEDTTEPFDRVQLLPNDQGTALLKRFSGQHVFVTASEGDVGITAHYHAPFAAMVRTIEADAEGRPDEGFPAMNTVRAFYSALEQGDGAEAARFVLPSKRASGPLSAGAMTRFYGSLATPLKLKDVRPLGQSDFEVRYGYRVGRGAMCNGRAVVSTVLNVGSNLIASIRSLSGC